ncbi:MAG: RluA family pseudouridine synthase [Bacteroidales bacterium]|nr:RluA family pseudouridine synthase [Bacteroidales bacterium]
MEVLYEDNHLIAVNKRSSDLSQGDRTGDSSLDQEVKKYISAKYKKPGDVYLGLVHRLDRPVCGVILFARTSKALKRMNEIFQKREVRKVYFAIVKEKPPVEEDTVIHFIKKNEKQNKSYVYPGEVKGSREARLKYRIAGRSERYYLLEVELYTGRHHQIRAQMAGIGCPVKGDLKYGYPRSNDDGSVSLFACKLEFMHPVKKEKIIIKAPFPETYVWKLFRDNPLVTGQS